MFAILRQALREVHAQAGGRNEELPNIDTTKVSHQYQPSVIILSSLIILYSFSSRRCGGCARRRAGATRRFHDSSIVNISAHWTMYLIIYPASFPQALREVHAEASGRNEALVALDSLTKEAAAKQARLVEAMQACQHLQSELEAAQVRLHDSRSEACTIWSNNNVHKRQASWLSHSDPEESLLRQQYLQSEVEAAQVPGQRLLQRPG